MSKFPKQPAQRVRQRVFAVYVAERPPLRGFPREKVGNGARTCVFGLCRSSPVNSPPAGGIGVRVLPASAALISNGDAYAFLAAQEKPEVLPVADIMQKDISIFLSYQT